jgi:hypothetical protein
VRYATAKGGETKSGFRPSSRIFKFFLLVGLAATELRLWAASGSRHLALHKTKPQHFDTVLTAPQPSKYQPRSPDFLSRRSDT